MEAKDDTKPTKNIDETLVIQHDWHLGLREPTSEFYIGVKPSGATQTEYFDVKITKLVDEYGFAVMPGVGTIKSSSFTNVSLDESVSDCFSENNQCNEYFRRIFTSHSKEKQPFS